MSMADYIKDAYKKIYQHPTWKEEAHDYEIRLAVALYKNPYVQQASQDALRRVSEVLTAYYDGRESGGAQTENKLDSAEELSAGMEQLSGQKSDTSTQEKAAKQHDAAEQAEANEKGPIAVNDVLTKAFLNTDATSAGQIDTGDASKREGLVNAVLNEDGNLREKMTMLFNATVYNAGRTEEKTNQSFTLKRLFMNISDKEARGNAALQGLNMKEIKNLRGGDIFATNRMADKMGKRSYSSLINAWKGFASRKVRQKKNGQERAGLGRKYYEDLGIGLSEREAALAAPAGSNGEISWREGVSSLKMDKNSKWVKERNRRGFQLIAGPSGTTMRMLGAYKMLGATKDQLLAFRLALIAWMGSSQDHSLYEILYGSKLIGVSGKEDLSEAAKTYMTVDPLTPPQLRSLAGKEGEFPHERVFETMLSELQKKRINFQKEINQRGSKNNELDDEDELDEDSKNLFTSNSLDSGHKKALNIYTTGAYQVMNQSMKYGKKIGWWLSARKMNNAAQKAEELQAAHRSLDSLQDIESIFNDMSLEEVNDEAMAKAVRSNIQIASAMSLEALRERSQYNSVGAEQDAVHDHLMTVKKGKAKTKYAKGVSYRGLGIMRMLSDFKEGSTVTLSSLTSTSRRKDTAITFYNKIKSKFLKPVLATYYLTNKSAVDISDTSRYNEDEVLLPRGAKFRVRTGLHLQDQMNQVELEEVAAPPDRALMVEENPEIAATLVKEPENAGIAELEGGGGTPPAKESTGVKFDEKDQQVLAQALSLIAMDDNYIVVRSSLDNLFPTIFGSVDKIVAALDGEITEEERTLILRQARMVISTIDTGGYDFLLPMENIIRNHFSALADAM